MRQNLRILQIILIPGGVHRFPGAGNCQRRDQLQVKSLAEQKMSQGAVVVAFGLKHDVNGHLEPMQIVGQTWELNCSVEQDQALAALPPGRLDRIV